MKKGIIIFLMLVVILQQMTIIKNEKALSVRTDIINHEIDIFLQSNGSDLITASDLRLVLHEINNK